MPVAAALDAIAATAEGLVRNPNELLQFQALFVGAWRDGLASG